MCRALLTPAFNKVLWFFRGAHESGGTWGVGALADDVEDVRVVVAYLTQEYGYEIDLLIGHSRGGIAAMGWLCTSDEGKNVGGFVNVSARYRMDVRGSRFLSKRVSASNRLGYRKYYKVSRYARLVGTAGPMFCVSCR